MNDLQALRPDDSQPTPLYLQLARNLESAIHAGQWKAEQAMPSERNLSEQLGISRVTARKALEVLLDQGLIRRLQGSGTFITPRLEQPLSRLSGFSEMLRLKGFVPSSQWLEREVTLPTHEELIRLSLSPNDKVARMKRLRLGLSISVSWCARSSRCATRSSSCATCARRRLISSISPSISGATPGSSVTWSDIAPESAPVEQHGHSVNPNPWKSSVLPPVRLARSRHERRLIA